VAAEAFMRRLKTAKGSFLSKAEFVRELSRLRSGAERSGSSGAATYEEIADRTENLVRMPHQRAAQRWLVLSRFNSDTLKALPYAHTGLTQYPHTLGARLCALRALLLADAKRKVWEESLPEGPKDDGVVKSGHVITLNRFEAEAAREEGDSGTSKHKTLWTQAYAQLHDFDVKKLRRRDRAFKIKFLGEGSDDYGGPFREALTNMCAELQHHPPRHEPALFILTPNGQSGTGNNRSAYTVHPQVKSKLGEFAFFGKLLGCSLLQRELNLDLELSDHVWKRLAGEDLSDLDLASYDESMFTSMRRLKHIDQDGIDEDLFGDLFFETFETTLSDGSRLELIEDGAATDVTFGTRKRFCELVVAARLAEGAEAYEAILAGLHSMVPSARLLRLFTGADLMHLVCGEADVDVKTLYAHTAYGASASANMAHVRFFWQVLEAFSPEQRRAFLKFIWGRNRLPFTEEDWGDARMKIHTKDCAGNPDQYFPIAHTCFFSIELPRYSSKDICYAKLLWAVNNCVSIDADNTREGRANMAGLEEN